MEAFVGVIGFNVLSSTINSIGLVTSNIFSLVTHIKVSKSLYHKELITCLMKTDIEHNIKLVEAIINEIPQYFDSTQSILIILNDVKDVMTKIEYQLREIHKKMMYNTSIYVFNNWRSYDFKENLEQLNILVEVFDRRKKTLFDVLLLFKNLSPEKKEENKKLFEITNLEKTEITNNFIKEAELL
jgi:hypothetical protein